MYAHENYSILMWNEFYSGSDSTGFMSSLLNSSFCK